MNPKVTSIRPFVGAKDYSTSIQFYKQIGFTELWTGDKMCYLDLDGFGFYLQDAYVKDWVDNTMLFLELEDPEAYLEHLKTLNITTTSPKVRLSKMVYNDWGMEFFLHDPSGVLWHIGKFKG